MSRPPLMTPSFARALMPQDPHPQTAPRRVTKEDFRIDDPRFHLRKISLNAQGYDKAGTYFGVGPQVWFYIQQDGLGMGHVRAKTRNEAKAMVLALHPTARFYA
jgi:hypothetical protein